MFDLHRNGIYAFLSEGSNNNNNNILIYSAAMKRKRNLDINYLG